jgi:hydrogenase nickel incorporation protein HypB
MPRVAIIKNILAANDTVAQEIHQTLDSRGICSLNLMSSPGSGKTTLLEKTIARLNGEARIGVIEGDIMTTADAERVERAGAQAVQIETQGTCHLEAHMVQSALAEMDLERVDLLMIENIGNLVCPADWNLGEDRRVIIISVTEGDDKPAKYPQMFSVADVLIINKIDLLPYVDFDCARVREYVQAIRPGIQIFETSARTGEGMDEWIAWIKEMLPKQG